ncbi:MAG: hypothetical protein K5696_09530 [Lachnospiraceae bacterium]|nr:hypothetical protein [Lachnospiraceae bacterium]
MPISVLQKLLANDLANPDIYDLKAILEALTMAAEHAKTEGGKGFRFQDDEWNETVRRLNYDFTAEPSQEWVNETESFLRGVQHDLDAALQAEMPDDPFSREAERFYQAYGEYRPVGRTAADHLKKEAAAGKKPDGDSGSAGRKRAPHITWRDLNALDETFMNLGFPDGEINMDPHELAPVIYAMDDQYGDMLQTSAPKWANRLAELKKEYYESKAIPNDWAIRAEQTLRYLYGYVTMFLSNNVLPGSELEHRFLNAMDIAKVSVEPKDVITGLPGKLDKQKEAVEQIRNVQLKMKQEHSGLHIDSAKYRDMKKAVDEVCRLADTPGGYDPVKMSAALRKLNQKASLYVEDKVLDKTKKTGLGIERKNTALLLMQATDPESVERIVDRIEDFRLDTEHDQAAESGDPDRKKTSFKKLMDAESGRNRARAEEKTGKGSAETGSPAKTDTGAKKHKAARAAKTVKKGTSRMVTPENPSIN